MAAADEAKRLARTLAELERRLRAVENGSQLGRSGLVIGNETVTVKDAIRASITASQDAAEAIDRAASAEAKADGVVNTYYTDGATPPSERPGLGDFWYRRDTKDVSVWDGAAWQPVTSTAIKQAIAAADLAAAAADGKISTWFLPSTKPPTNPGEGDIWFVTDQANRQRRYNGTTWDDVRDGAIEDALDKASEAADKAAGAQAAALVAMNSANGKTKVVYSTSDPGGTAGVNVGDTWFTRDSNNFILRQYNWTGSSWQSVILTNATVTSLDAGRITTGSLAAGVSITAGTPGGSRVELGSFGLRAYNASGFNYITLGQGIPTVTGELRSGNAVSGGTSYAALGNTDDGDGIEGLMLVRPGGSKVTFKNLSNSGGGLLDLSLRNGSNVNQGGFQFSLNSLISTSAQLNLGASFGSTLRLGGQSANLQGNGYGVNIADSSSIYISSSYILSLQGSSQISGYGASVLWQCESGGGLQIGRATNGAYGNTLLRSAYYGGGALKLTSDGSVQIRDYNDYGYSYIRGIVQDQSSPDLKEHIVEINTDALAELSGMRRYAYDWKRNPLVPFVQPPPDSSTGILLSEVPYSVQQSEDGYATGSLLGLIIAGVNQLVARVEALESSLSNPTTT